jgi:hypothetical protein
MGQEVTVQDRLAKESAIEDDVKEMFHSLLNVAKESTHQHQPHGGQYGLSFDMLMSWDKIQEAVGSGFVSVRTVDKLFRSVSKGRALHNGTIRSSSSSSNGECGLNLTDFFSNGECGLNLTDFDQFCLLLQRTIDADSESSLSCDCDSNQGDGM